MRFPILLLIHISGAVLGILSGFLAMTLRKGSGWHAVAGNAFTVSMIAMSTSAAYMATFVHPVALNVVVGLLTFYLVTTAWWAAKRRDPAMGLADIAGMLYIVALTCAAMRWGIEGLRSAGGTKDTVPAAIYFIFGTVALLCAATDIRMLRRGTLAGARRLARHLWRMSLALLIATLSLYPGQAKLFPQAIRDTNLLFIPHVLLIGSMLFWMARVSRQRRARQREVVRVEQEPVMVDAA